MAVTDDGIRNNYAINIYTRTGGTFISPLLAKPSSVSCCKGRLLLRMSFQTLLYWHAMFFNTKARGDIILYFRIHKSLSLEGNVVF